LADAGIAAVAGAAGRNGPLAFVTRLDTWRKGLDRLCYWLDACRDELPRPAVVLYAPDDGSSVPELMPGLMADGLLRWDTTSRGADLVHELQQARGVGLLSRWDGQPRVLREAALLGLPTLSTPASHFADVVTALGTGVMVHDPDEPRAVQRAFEALATQPRDPEPARRLFHRDSVGETLLALLQAAGASPRPAPVDHYRRFATPTSATLLDG
jgi:glycosyltransferase involved in cell wall biosynthesis